LKYLLTHVGKKVLSRSSYEERGLKYLLTHVGKKVLSRSSYEERGLKSTAAASQKRMRVALRMRSVD